MINTRKPNNGVSPSLKLHEIAKLVSGELVGDRDLTITGIAGIQEAGPGDITVLSNLKYLPYLEQTRASAVITSKEVSFGEKPLIRTTNPAEAFNRIITFFKPVSKSATGCHPTAVISPDVCIGKGVSVGPHAVIEEGCIIGDRTRIEANCFIGSRCHLGNDVILYPNVTVREDTEIGNRVIVHSGTVIASDGFGYETVDDRHIKIPQIGSVCIEDDVEIGANVCIDRGRFKKTWIQRGTKIDNLVQIAHNVVVGPDCLIISQAGISGSTELGKNVVVAGQAGIVGHITLGDRAIIGASAGVSKSVPQDTVVLGSPAKPIHEQKKLFAYMARLPDLFKDVAGLKKKISQK